MSEDRVRRQVSDLLEGFGPPSPGLAARAVAGLPDRRARAGARWIAAAVAGLAVAAVAVLLLDRARRHPWADPRYASPARPDSRSCASDHCRPSPWWSAGLGR